MSGYGFVQDLFEEKYLQLEDIVHNVQPFPKLVPYHQYDEIITLYKIDTDLDVIFSQLQTFTDRLAQATGDELWTWAVQLKVEHEPQAIKKRRREEPSVPNSISGHGLRDPQPKRGFASGKRRLFDRELLQSDQLLRMLMHIVQAPWEKVPDFIELLYHWLDCFGGVGDGYGLACARRHEIPSLSDFPSHSIRKYEVRPVRPRKGDDRRTYAERKWGLEAPEVKPKTTNVPTDIREQYQYGAACFKARDAARRLLLEAGVTDRQIANYMPQQATIGMSIRQTPTTGVGRGLAWYKYNMKHANAFCPSGDLRQIHNIALNSRGNESRQRDDLNTEAATAARVTASGIGNHAPRHSTSSSTLILPTASSSLNSNVNTPGAGDNTLRPKPENPQRELLTGSGLWTKGVRSLQFKKVEEPAKPEADPDESDIGQWNFGRWAGFSGDEIGSLGQDLVGSFAREGPYQPPIDSAVHFVDYVIRRNSAESARAPVDHDNRLSRDEQLHLQSMSDDELRNMSPLVAENVRSYIEEILRVRQDARDAEDATAALERLSDDELRYMNGLVPNYVQVYIEGLLRHREEHRAGEASSAGSSGSGSSDSSMIDDDEDQGHFLQHGTTSNQNSSGITGQGPYVPTINITAGPPTAPNTQGSRPPAFQQWVQGLANWNTTYTQMQTPLQSLPPTPVHSGLTPGISGLFSNQGTQSGLTPGISGLSVNQPALLTSPAPACATAPPVLPPHNLPFPNHFQPQPGLNHFLHPIPIRTNLALALEKDKSPIPPSCLSKGIPVLLHYPSILLSTFLNFTNPSLPLGDPDPSRAAPPTDTVLLGYLVNDNSSIDFRYAVFLPTVLRITLTERVKAGGYRVLESYSAVESCDTYGLKGGKEVQMERSENFGGLRCVHECAYDKLRQAWRMMTGLEDEKSKIPAASAAKEGIDMSMHMALDPDSKASREQARKEQDRAREQLLTKRWRVTPGTSLTGNRGAVWEGYGLWVDKPLVMLGRERSGRTEVFKMKEKKKEGEDSDSEDGEGAEEEENWTENPFL